MPILGPVGDSADDTVTCDMTTGNWELPDGTVFTQYACYSSGPACPCPGIDTLQRSFANAASVDSPLTFQPILNLQGCEVGAVVTCSVPAGFTSFLQLITLAGATNTIVGGVNMAVVETASCNQQFGQWSFNTPSFVQFQALGCTFLDTGPGR